MPVSSISFPAITPPGPASLDARAATPQAISSALRGEGGRTAKALMARKTALLALHRLRATRQLVQDNQTHTLDQQLASFEVGMANRRSAIAVQKLGSQIGLMNKIQSALTS